MNVTKDDIAQLLACPPPRSVPRHVARAAMSTRGSMLGIVLLSLLGGAGGIWLTIAGFPARALDEFRLWRDSVRTAGTIVTRVKSGSDFNGTPIFSCEFTYKPKGETQARKGRAYVVGEVMDPGAVVVVRYVPSRPEIACPAEARLTEPGVPDAVALLVPLLVVVGPILLLRARRTAERVLVHGTAARVEVLSIDLTGKKVNYETEYAVTLSAPAGVAGGQIVTERTATEEINWLTQRAIQKTPVAILYDPAKPENLIFVEHLIDD